MIYMKIIKIQIQVPSRRGGTKILKQAVSLDEKYLRSIDQFIAYAKQVCQLKDNYTLQMDGFRISGEDTVRMLQEGKIYNLKINTSKKKKNVQKEQSSSSSSYSSSSLSSASNYDVEEEQSSESSSEQSEERVLINRQRNTDKISKSKQMALKIKRKRNENPSSDSQDNSTPKKSKQKPSFKANVPIIKSKKRHIVESSSSEESSEELPLISQVKSNVKLTQKVFPTRGSNIVTQPKKQKAVIKVSSESESSPTPQIQPQKAKQPAVQKNQTISTTKVQPIKLPPALRNQPKSQLNKFEQHRQDQWLQVDKEKLKKWKDLGHETFSQPPNKIRFKVIQFDQEKFIPVKSNWIKGEVSSIEDKGSVCLINVQQQGSKEFKKQFKIPEINMDQLQVWKPLASKQQIQVLLGDQNLGKEGELGKKETNIVSTEVKNIENSEGDQKNSQNSVQKFICGQVNYYFSDRNYSTDFFMQLHANTHPQKYIKLGLMLNFPKIKKVLKDEDKLLTYLRQDEKYETRNYEIDFDTKMIRKKHIQDPREMHKKQEDHNKNEQEKKEEKNQIEKEDNSEQ